MHKEPLLTEHDCLGGGSGLLGMGEGVPAGGVMEGISRDWQLVLRVFDEEDLELQSSDGKRTAVLSSCEEGMLQESAHHKLANKCILPCYKYFVDE